jgi:hypothetical protein
MARFAIPDDDGFPLIGNANSRNVSRADVCGFYGYSRGFNRRMPNFHRIVFNPAGLRKMLGKLPLGYGHRLEGFVKEDGSGTRCALV